MLLSKHAEACLAISYFEEMQGSRRLSKGASDRDLSGSLEMSGHDLAKLLNISLQAAREFISWHRSWQKNETIKRLKNRGVKVLTQLDELYPVWLKNIPDSPLILYYLGCPPPHNNNLTVVGSRQASAYGLKATEKILAPAVAAGFNIISGLAVGIDTAAHQAALKNGGRTWAILGSGLGVIYPSTNCALARQIICMNGGVISEFPLFTPPRPRNFPRRNRILSGLSAATLVIEASQQSGSLITSRYALEQGREVYAIPGNIFSPSSAGTNSLIATGATPINSTDDLVNNLLNLQNLP